MLPNISSLRPVETLLRIALKTVWNSYTSDICSGLMEPDTLIKEIITINYLGVIMGQKRAYKQYSNEYKEGAVGSWF